MAAAKKTTSDPGVESDVGSADEPRPAPPPRDYPTHFPSRNGAACGVVMTHAKYYDPIAPTCPWCAKYVADVKRITEARYGRTQAQTPSDTPPATSRDGRKPTESES